MSPVPMNYVRMMSYVEGISLLLLIFVAMPTKRFLGEPSLTKNLGAAHGILFLAFAYTLISTAFELKWPKKWLFFALFCACVPFGFFWFDKKLASTAEIHKEKE